MSDVAHYADGIVPQLKQLYRRYAETEDIDSRATFFSTKCRQICRPIPSFAAKERSTIIKYLHETAGKDNEMIQSLAEGEVEGDGTKHSLHTKPQDTSSGRHKKSYYSIRPLEVHEVEFGADDIVQPAGFLSAEDVKRTATAEGWVGLRVDLWDDEGVDESGLKKGLLVKVQYWWREEDNEWLQILHDIMYLGARDGTEGSEGEVVERLRGF